MVREVEKAGAIYLYNYRRIPAVTLAEMIDEGRLGKIYHCGPTSFRTGRLTDLPQGGEGLRRLDAKVAGSG